MDPNTEAILLMVWARSLGLSDDALADPDAVVLNGRTDAPLLTVLHLDGRLAVAGPPWAVERADDYSPDALQTVAGLLALAKDHTPRIERAETLHYLDDYSVEPHDSELLVTTDPAAFDELRVRCTPDDLTHSGIERVEQRVVLLDSDERPIAAAGWSDWQGIVADLAVVGAVDARATESSRVIGRFAVEECLDLGLIPQLRVTHDDARATALAESLSFVAVGEHLVVQFGS